MSSTSAQSVLILRPWLRLSRIVVLYGEQVETNTKTSLRSGDRYRVDYKLHFNNPGGRVYDVIVEGISLVENYRSQFDRVLSRKSFDALLENLRAKKDTFN